VKCVGISCDLIFLVFYHNELQNYMTNSVVRYVLSLLSGFLSWGGWNLDGEIRKFIKAWATKKKLVQCVICSASSKHSMWSLYGCYKRKGVAKKCT